MFPFVHVHVHHLLKYLYMFQRILMHRVAKRVNNATFFYKKVKVVQVK